MKVKEDTIVLSFPTDQDQIDAIQKYYQEHKEINPNGGFGFNAGFCKGAIWLRDFISRPNDEIANKYIHLTEQEAQDAFYGACRREEDLIKRMSSNSNKKVWQERLDVVVSLQKKLIAIYPNLIRSII